MYEISDLRQIDIDFPVKTKKKSSKKFYTILFMLTLILGILNIGAYAYTNQSKEEANNNSLENNQTRDVTNLNADVKGLETCQNPLDSDLVKSLNWWNDNYNYFQEIYVNKRDGFDDNKWIQVEFDHFSLVSDKKSRPDGSDLRLVVKFDENQFKEVPFKLSDTNQIYTKIEFEYLRDQQIFLYYGDLHAEDKSYLHDYELNSKESYEISLSGEVTYPIKISTNRSWVLKQYQDSNLELTVSIDSKLNIDVPVVNYEIINTDISSAIVQNENGEFVANIPTDGLDPGRYQIQAVLSDDCYDIKSPKQSFILSYPLFVAWTMDWEGYATTQANLDLISTLSDKYSVPITQFFNPRIFVTNSIPQANKNLMTDWVKTRRDKNGDEIGLHLHMWKDLITQTGVTPRNGPQWDVMNNGYDVLFSAYTYEESSQIVKWSLEELKRQGFESVTSFRAGGWEIDTDNLRALETNGIKVDSSGRTKHNLGSRLIPSQWNLESTTKPYRPSKTDINKTNSDFINIWEFPNNGADSYLYSYEQMKERFDANFPGEGEVVREPQTVTYLSHTHWFNVDNPKLDLLFGEISRYKYSDDHGPIIFTTLNETQKYWSSR